MVVSEPQCWMLIFKISWNYCMLYTVESTVTFSFKPAPLLNLYNWPGIRQSPIKQWSMGNGCICLYCLWAEGCSECWLFFFFSYADPWLLHPHAVPLAPRGVAPVCTITSTQLFLGSSPVLLVIFKDVSGSSYVVTKGARGCCQCTWWEKSQSNTFWGQKFCKIFMLRSCCF